MDGRSGHEFVGEYSWHEGGGEFVDDSDLGGFLYLSAFLR
jgi:hypothetical protein